ncbi:MAG: phospholipid carrier-dependent glycosyltransferase [Patescibacteria group bacterium]
MRKHLALIVILLASIAVHFAFFGHPRQTVFDEVHFGKFVSGYFTHEYFFDIHPPLGKLIISGAAKMAGFEPGFSFGQIGEQFPNATYKAMRLLPSIAGTLLPVVIFLLLLELKFSKGAAMTAGLLIAFDNALLVQSRFMLLDSFLLLLGFLSWWLYAKFRNSPTTHYSLFTSAAIFAGAAASVKWTGITFLAVIGILELIRVIRERTRFLSLVVLIFVPFLVYYALFTIHFSLLSQPGPGDAFMSQDFRDGKLSSFEKFNELNSEMYRANARLTATHPYSSKWYQWPFMVKGIYYWNSANEKIYLLGNPIIWWASTFGILYILINSVTARNTMYWLLSGAYLLNILPFIGIDRAMFLYHYFTGLIIAIIALVYFVDSLKNRNKIFAVLLAASFVVFLYFAPLSYGLQLSEKAFQHRMWLESWK